ncbi:hypothetical protein FRC11_013454, partial [Ceratobasidium sp. 423]
MSNNELETLCKWKHDNFRAPAPSPSPSPSPSIAILMFSLRIKDAFARIIPRPLALYTTPSSLPDAYNIGIDHDWSMAESSHSETSPALSSCSIAADTHDLPMHLAPGSASDPSVYGMPLCSIDDPTVLSFGEADGQDVDGYQMSDILNDPLR